MTGSNNVSHTLDSLISEYEALLSIVRTQAENEKRLCERLDFAANEVRNIFIRISFRHMMRNV
jgi:hypothetical protein